MTVHVRLVLMCIPLRVVLRPMPRCHVRPRDGVRSAVAPVVTNTASCPSASRTWQSTPDFTLALVTSWAVSSSRAEPRRYIRAPPL